MGHVVSALPGGRGQGDPCFLPYGSVVRIEDCEYLFVLLNGFFMFSLEMWEVLTTVGRPVRQGCV